MVLYIFLFYQHLHFSRNSKIIPNNSEDSGGTVHKIY